MGTIISYYLNGPTLGTATGIFDNANFSTVAADGYYSQGTVVRQVLAGILLPRGTCPSCATPCPVTTGGDDVLGLYSIPIELTSAVGAVKVSFDPDSVPDGIRAVYNGVVFNAFSAAVDGYHATTVANGLTYMGNVNDVSGLEATHSLPEYDLYDGAFTLNGDTASVVVSAGSISTSASDPGECVLYIPKTSSTILSLLIEVVEALSESPSWSLTVGCPAPLAAWTCTAKNPDNACTDSLGDTIFVGKVSGSANDPAVNDWAFDDANASSKKPAGTYGVENLNTTKWSINVDANGIITAITAC